MIAALPDDPRQMSATQWLALGDLHQELADSLMEFTDRAESLDNLVTERGESSDDFESFARHLTRRERAEMDAGIDRGLDAQSAIAALRAWEQQHGVWEFARTLGAPVPGEDEFPPPDEIMEARAGFRSLQRRLRLQRAR
jgi:hypothetical protein